MNLSTSQLNFLALHVKHPAERWQWYFGNTQLRAHAGKTTATIWRDDLDDLIARGCAKVNISTALKIAFMSANKDFFQEKPNNTDPPSLLKFVRERVKQMAVEHIRAFHSDGKAA